MDVKTIVYVIKRFAKHNKISRLDSIDMLFDIRYMMVLGCTKQKEYQFLTDPGEFIGRIREYDKEIETQVRLLLGEWLLVEL